MTRRAAILARCSTLSTASKLAFCLGRQQRHHNPGQFRQTILFKKDRIEAGCGELLCSEVYARCREADNLRLGKDLAQSQGRLGAGRLRHAQVEEDHVATGLLRLLDRCSAVACLGENPVGNAGLKERPDGAAHGGAVAGDEDSRHAYRFHGSRDYYGSNSENNTDLRIFSSITHFLTLPQHTSSK